MGILEEDSCKWEEERAFLGDQEQSPKVEKWEPMAKKKKSNYL